MSSFSRACASYVSRELRNRRYSRKVERARLTRLQRVRTAGEKVVQYDIPEYEARARDTILTGAWP